MDLPVFAHSFSCTFNISKITAQEPPVPSSMKTAGIPHLLRSSDFPNISEGKTVWGVSLAWGKACKEGQTLIILREDLVYRCEG